MQSRCVVCHTGPSAPLGLRLDNLDNVLKGSQNGPVAVGGKPEASELIRRLKGVSSPRMPMTGPPFLSDGEVGLFERWIALGMKPGSNSSEARLAPVRVVRPKSGEPVTYAHVAPIFAQRCAKCHSPSGLIGPAPEGYQLTSYETTISSVDRARVIPGSAEASELVRRIRGQALPRMPFDGPPYLNDEEAKLITDWINQGAKNTEGERAANPEGARVRLHGKLGSGWRLDSLETDTRSAVELMFKAPSVLSRFEGIGTVPPADAVAIGLVGPSARACGLELDVRQNFPYGIYRFAYIPTSTWPSGDCFARAYVRWMEVQRSIEFLRAQLPRLPQGAIHRSAGSLNPEMLTISLSEGWRGEIVHVVMTDSRGRYLLYKVVDPSFHNWFGLALALRNQQISDFPLCNKSFNLSYCGHDL